MGGATYECKTPDDKPPTTFAPPMVITPGGAQVSQVGVVARALGKELNMWPTDLPGDMKAMQLCCDGADFASDLFEKKGNERLEKWALHFESQLDVSGGPFMFGKKLTAVDYVICSYLVMSGNDIAFILTKAKKMKLFMEEMQKQKGFKAVEAKCLPLMP